MDHLLEHAPKLLQRLCETTSCVFLQQRWNLWVETTSVTVLEFLEEVIVVIVCLEDDQPIQAYHISKNSCQAWAATGHANPSKIKSITNEMWLPWLVNYKVLISTVLWCPKPEWLGFCLRCGHSRNNRWWYHGFLICTETSRCCSCIGKMNDNLLLLWEPVKTPI